MIDQLVLCHGLILGFGICGSVVICERTIMQPTGMMSRDRALSTGGQSRGPLSLPHE
jgi:hypothetical protein